MDTALTKLIEQTTTALVRAACPQAQAFTWDYEGGYDDCCTVEIFTDTERINLSTLGEPLRAVLAYQVRALIAATGKTSGMSFLR